MDVRKHNMEYLGLNDKQYDEHERIMQLPMSQWDKALYEYCVKQSHEYGMSGDAIACWVADWLKGRANDR